jgi:hypothetical protein
MNAFAIFMLVAVVCMTLPAFLNDCAHNFGAYDDGAWMRQGWQQ